MAPMPPEFKLDQNDFHFICAADPDRCRLVFDGEEAVEVMAIHMREGHPDTWDGKNVTVELVPQCHRCGSPRVRVYSKEPNPAYRCLDCDIVMAGGAA